MAGAGGESSVATTRGGRWPGFPLLPDGSFPIAGWCTPPVRETTPERLREYRDAGFTVLLPALEDPYLEARNRERLEIAAEVGLWAIVRDDRVHPDEARRPGWEDRVRASVDAYGRMPALLGYFLADEPGPETFSSLAGLTARYAALDRQHPAYANLYGLSPAGYGYAGRTYRAFLEEFLDATRPALFSVDHYTLRRDGDTPNFCPGLDTTRQMAARFDAAFWSILQLTPHLEFRDLGVGELLWQAHLSLAYGAKGIVWFTYWTPRPDETGYRDGPIAYDGRRTPAYQRVARVNRSIQSLGRAIGDRVAVDVRHHGTMPRDGRPLDGTFPLVRLEGGDVTVGFLVGRGDPGARSPSGSPADTLALLVSRDYREATRASAGWRRTAERWDAALGDWTPLAGTRAEFALEPGGAVLLRLRAPGAGP